MTINFGRVEKWDDDNYDSPNVHGFTCQTQGIASKINIFIVRITITN